jgi:hypothetical protein
MEIGSWGLMSNSAISNSAFIKFEISSDMEKNARKIRTMRDQKYGNIYEEHESDERWVGDLGEICINNWIKSFGFVLRKDYDWVLENASGNPDFIIGTVSLDVKTVKRKVPPRSNYTAQITARHSREVCDYYFFCSYEIVRKIMWLLGGISKQDFLNQAIYYKAGAWVHENYQIREGHEIFNIEIAKLLSCQSFAKEIGLTRSNRL